MSTSAPVVDTPEKSTDQNAQASADAEKLLAELQGEADSKPQEQESTTEDVNGPPKAKAVEQNPTKSPSEQRKPSDGHEKNDRRENGHSGRGGRGGGARGRGGSKNFRNNIKSDLTTQEISKDPVAIRKQVEFYFSDSNLPMDKFLLGKVGGRQNNPVELDVIHSFKRMRHFQPLEAIIAALRDSSFLELTDNDTCVRRKEPLPEALNDGSDRNAVKVFEDKAMPRSVYVKGFGEELPSTQFDIEAFFAPYGPTNAIRLRRTDQKLFKGSVFAEFENDDLAAKFLELEPKPKYKGRDLQIMSKKEYCDKKIEDIKSGKIKPSNNRGSLRKDDRKGGRDSKRKRDDEDNRDWRERRDEDRKNGFKNDKRRGGDEDHNAGDKGNRSQVEKDDRGVPVVKTSVGSEDKSEKDTGRADALAKARAAVEAENKREGQSTADNIETTEQEGVVDVKTKDADVVAQSLKDDVEGTSKKRAREDDGTDGGPEAKKVDSKVET